MITEIHMNAVASFKNATVLATDKRINIIYGLNGTGKSTISTFLYDHKNPRFSQCKKLPEQSDPILVYNQAFIHDNFFVADSLKGVFSLSKQNKDAEEKIKNATATLNKQEQHLQIKRTEKQKVTENFETQKQQAAEEIWKVKTAYSGGDRVLEYCLEGLKGQKEKLFSYLIAIEKPKTEPQKTIPLLKEDVESLKGESAQPQQHLIELNLNVQEIESDPIWEKPIVGNSDSEVAALIEKLGHADWVKEGLSYVPQHLDENGQPCPFCQANTITSKIVKDIKEYFGDSYQKQITSLENLKKQYVSVRETLPDLKVYTSHKSSENHSEILSKKYQALLKIFDANITTIEAKLKNPKSPQSLKASIGAITDFNNEIKVINAVIKTYNDRLKSREAALNSIKTEFWAITRWQYDQTISRYEKDRNAANQKLKVIDAEIEKVNNEIALTRKTIAAAQKETVNVDEAVDAINSALLELAIEDFKITKHSGNFYRVVRQGESEDAFHSLSEGEKMMISFLYFCELCKGRASAEDTQSRRIVVIDDPISSLSHIFIFNVGQLIKTLFFKSERFSQVYVLTHSLYFYYELADTNHERRKNTQKLFRISKTSSGSSIQEMKYEEIQNDYQTYWSIINDPNQPPALIANCMRNIVEYFFSFVRKKDLNNVFLMPELQDMKFQAFCRYVSRESHSIGQNIIDLKEFDYATFKEGLRLIFTKTGYPEHFNAMSAI